MHVRGPRVVPQHLHVIFFFVNRLISHICLYSYQWGVIYTYKYILSIENELIKYSTLILKRSNKNEGEDKNISTTEVDNLQTFMQQIHFLPMAFWPPSEVNGPWHMIQNWKRVFIISISISKAYSWTTGMSDRQMDKIKPFFF